MDFDGSGRPVQSFRHALTTDLRIRSQIMADRKGVAKTYCGTKPEAFTMPSHRSKSALRKLASSDGAR